MLTHVVTASLLCLAQVPHPARSTGVTPAAPPLADGGSAPPPATDAGLPTAPDPQAMEAYEEGVGRIRTRNYRGAVKSLTRAIAMAPTLAPAYIARGSAQLALRRFRRAASDYERGLSLDESRASALYGLAQAYRALGRADEARDLYARYAASTAPDVVPALQKEAAQRAASPVQASPARQVGK